MEWFSPNHVSGKILDHLGLVAATVDKIRLTEKIDSRIPLAREKGAKITMGQRVAAMIMNGLGFVDDRLYLFPEFLKNKPVDRLFGENIAAEHFNDDAIGRALDAIHAYGVTKLFSELALEIGAEHKLLGKSANLDTSTLSLHGDYPEDCCDTKDTLDENKDVPEVPVPRHGYSKDHRPDLKQMVINLATTGSAGFPVWMESHSGNASDKVILHEAAKRMKAFCEKLKDAPSFLHVADSAMYDACLKENGSLLWLSRVPETHKAAREWLEVPETDIVWTELDRGYRICSRETEYRGVLQRWQLIYSEQAYLREAKTLEKRILKENEAQKKLWWHLGNQLFQCEADAKKQAERLEQKLLYHAVRFEVIPEKKYPGKGRPAKDAVEITAGYRIKYDIERSEKTIALILRRKGRFILATNQMDTRALPDVDILPEYKGQSKTESGFRFIKDNTFEVASVFLKKPERISALMMIMTLCLMVYGVAQHHLRESLDKSSDSVPDQTRKPTSRPTMKWIYRIFCNIQVIALEMEGHIREIVINVTDIHRKIIRYFGEVAMRIYEVSPA